MTQIGGGERTGRAAKLWVMGRWLDEDTIVRELHRHTLTICAAFCLVMVALAFVFRSGVSGQECARPERELPAQSDALQ